MHPRRSRTITPFLLDDDLRKLLRKVSLRKDVSMAHLIRKYIRAGLHRELRDKLR